MKSIKVVLMTLAIVMSMIVFAGNEKATIQTSAKCEMCKEKIEGAVAEMAGVSKVMLNEETKELKVKFDDEVTSLEAIRKGITALGYNADDMPADKDAYAALPKCCKASSCCAAKTSCSKTEATTKTSCSKTAATSSCSKDKKSCGEGCTKTCCANKEVKSCAAGCTKACCAAEKVAE